jgi:hypothetical protein
MRVLFLKGGERRLGPAIAMRRVDFPRNSKEVVSCNIYVSDEGNRARFASTGREEPIHQVRGLFYQERPLLGSKESYRREISLVLIKVIECYFLLAEREPARAARRLLTESFSVIRGSSSEASLGFASVAFFRESCESIDIESLWKWIESRSPLEIEYELGPRLRESLEVDEAESDWETLRAPKGLSDGVSPPPSSI